MPSISKLIFYFALAVIIFFIYEPIVAAILHLEFSVYSAGERFEEFRFCAIPVAIVCTLAGTLSQSNSYPVILAKILISFFVAGCVCVLLIFFSFADMCAYSKGETWFVNKVNPNIKVVRRDFGCGATDSSPASVSFWKIRQITPFLIKADIIDTLSIDMNKWQRVKSKPTSRSLKKCQNEAIEVNWLRFCY